MNYLRRIIVFRFAFLKNLPDIGFRFMSFVSLVFLVVQDILQDNKLWDLFGTFNKVYFSIDIFHGNRRNPVTIFHFQCLKACFP